MAPTIEARVGGRIGRYVVVVVCRRVMARFVGIGRKDRNCGWTSYRGTLELECTLPHIAAIFVPGYTTPASRAVADIHQRAFGKIENKLGLWVGRPAKRNAGIGLAHYGECGASTHGKRHGSRKHSYQSAHASPLAILYLGTRSAQFHQTLQPEDEFARLVYAREIGID